MKRLVIGVFYVLLLIATIIYLVSLNKKNEVITSKIKKLPSINFVDIYGIDSNTNEFEGDSAYVLIFFSTECDACIKEAEYYSYNQDQLQKFHFFMLSQDSLLKIKKFAEKYQLSAIDNFNFGQIDNVCIQNNWNIYQSPNVYIYNAEKELISHHKVISVEHLIKQVNKK